LPPSCLQHLPKHQGTGRAAALIRGTVADLEPPFLGGERYILFVAAQGQTASPTSEQARAWIEAGASYVCAWGSLAEEVETSFDFATFIPELGPPLSYTLMTTSHAKETLEEALWFAFYCASGPDDLEAELNRVVIVANTTQTQKQCESWVRTNAE
jgi:hypothetical protein